jgi:hypothetical protein
MNPFDLIQLIASVIGIIDFAAKICVYLFKKIFSPARNRLKKVFRWYVVHHQIKAYLKSHIHPLDMSSSQAIYIDGFGGLKGK